MKAQHLKITRLFLLLIFLISVQVMTATAQNSVTTDKEIEEWLNRFSGTRSLPVNELIIKIGTSMLGTPYVAQTLESKENEHLIVELKKVDCTTFVETVLATARTIKSGQLTAGNYKSQLTLIRYRDGVLDGYTSRLHYFTEWIHDNQSRGVVKDITKDCGGIASPLKVGFMSAHPDAYPMLTGKPGEIEKIATIEKQINNLAFYQIPVSAIKANEEKIPDGSIVALATSIQGMDVSHTGFLLRKNGRIHLLHASSLSKKVEITEQPLTDYLLKSKKTTGIVVIKALDTPIQ